MHQVTLSGTSQLLAIARPPGSGSPISSTATLELSMKLPPEVAQQPMYWLISGPADLDISSGKTRT